MKKQIFAVAAVLLFTTLAPQSHAQYATRANVPFAFQVGNTAMPAGEYQIQRTLMGSGTTQQIRRVDSTSSEFISTSVVDSRDKNVDPKLIFHCYSGDCFLTEIWAESGHGWKVVESRREKELAQAQVSAGTELAVVSLPITAKP